MQIQHHTTKKKAETHKPSHSLSIPSAYYHNDEEHKRTLRCSEQVENSNHETRIVMTYLLRAYLFGLEYIEIHVISSS